MKTRGSSVAPLPLFMAWKRDTKLAKVLLRKLAENVRIYRVLAEYRLVPFEAKAPQPIPEFHDGP